MLFGLEYSTTEPLPDYEFKYKQKVHLEKTPVFKSADTENFFKLVTGDFYVQNTRPVRGMIKLVASERDCDIRMDTLWYARVKDLVNIIKKRRS
jgi:hypothetical protein